MSKSTEEDVSSEYELGVLLGRGAFGDVYEAFHRPSKTLMAMKVVDRRKMGDSDMNKHVKREIAIMKLLKHPNVVSVRFDSNS